MNGTDAGSAVAAAAAAAPPTTGAASLAPGFRFHPTDEELVSYYLKRKVAGRPLRVDAIAEVDLYRLEPWELPGLSRIRSRDMEWFFFSPLDRKQSNRGRTNRATADGYWKTTGKDRSIRHGSCVVGMKKTLVFHSGRAPRGARTNWVMHEYRLAGDDRSEAGVPQDAYVVCRIFQKNGAGPQNGAQYGAPFVEEEWEDESAGQLSMMNEVGEFVDAGEPEYLQYNDLQNQNSEGQHDIPVVLQASPVGQHGGENADDTTALLDELLKEPSLINDIVDPVDEMGHPIPIHDFKREPHAEASSHISLVQTDEFLELNDLSDILNAGKLSSEDSMNHLVRNRHDESFQDRVGDGSNFKNTFKDEGSMNTVHQHPDQLEALQMRSFGDNMFMNSDRSHQQLEDVLAFYDAPGDDLAFIHNNFVQLNEFYHSPVAEQPSYDVPDDLMAYFDASDDNLQYDVPSFPEESEIFNSIMTQSNLANAAPGSIVTPGASFSASVLADDQLMNNYEGLNAESDLPENQGKANLPASQGKDKTVAGRLASMLGSIAAPSAYAAEIPSIPRKYFEGSFDNGSTNSLRVTAEPLHIHGLPVSGNAEHWSLQKNGDMGYLLSYNVKDDVVKKSPGSQSITKSHGPAFSGVLRGGFCLFFLSAAILGISYKVGLCIYGR